MDLGWRPMSSAKDSTAFLTALKWEVPSCIQPTDVSGPAFIPLGPERLSLIPLHVQSFQNCEVSSCISWGFEKRFPNPCAALHGTWSSFCLCHNLPIPKGGGQREGNGCRLWEPDRKAISWNFHQPHEGEWTHVESEDIQHVSSAKHGANEFTGY